MGFENTFTNKTVALSIVSCTKTFVTIDQSVSHSMFFSKIFTNTAVIILTTSRTARLKLALTAVLDNAHISKQVSK